MSGKVEFKTPSGGSVGLSFADTATDDVLELPAGNGDLYGQQNILGTVSQASGVPTGAIIERGSNANGEYVKYADGTLKCWDEGRSSSTGTTWTFPVAFSEIPSVTATAQATLSRFITVGSPTVSSTTIYGWQDDGNSSGATAAVHAIGRWF